MDSTKHRRLLDVTSRQFEDPPAVPVQDRRYLRLLAPPESYDLLELTDGKVIERFSRTQVVEGAERGRVWSYRDITERRRQEAVIDEQRRLAEFGRDIGLAFIEGDSLEEMLDRLAR